MPKYSVCVLLCCLVWPGVVWSQSQTGAPKEGPPANSTLLQTPPDLSKDTQFLALLRARDRDFALIGELRRIIAYHDNFRARIERLFNNMSNEPNVREQMISRTNSAIARLLKFENDVKAESELAAKIVVVRKFDEDFPLDRDDLGLTRVRAEPRNLNLESERALFVQRERANANEVFQNVSIENREWLTSYEKLFTAIERRLTELAWKFSQLDKLPTNFARFAGASNFESLTESQIQSGIDRYRNVLQTTLNEITAAQPSASVESVRTSLMGQIDNLGRDLVGRSTEASSQFRDLEKSISQSAKSLYGNKVGADSFNYLLIIFAGVFIVIMVAPKFYPEIVATNILKSEFLLQFSTVFVLVAAIIILAIGELIAKDQLPVLLAGISGYVLGQLGKT